MNELVKLKDSQLLEKFSVLVSQEREVVVEVILHLAEIDRRKLYAEEGYSSLFSYCVEKYHYSEGAAYRRIQSSKVYQKFPHILGLLKEGKVNLMTLSLIEPYLNPENGRALIDKVLGKSKREVEEILLEFSFKKQKTQDVIRRLPIKKSVLDNSAQNFTFTGESEKIGKNGEVSHKPSVSNEGGSLTIPLFPCGTGTKEPEVSLEMPMALSDTGKNKVQEIRRVKIEFVAEEGVAKMIERAKELLRHKYPEGKLEDLVREAFELLLEKKDPERKILKQEKKEILRAEPALRTSPARSADSSGGLGMTNTHGTTSRYIPQETKLNVWKRDQGQCRYESPEGRKCQERAGLELDHIEPFALGGNSTPENLRLLCRVHNQWRAIQTFGIKQ